MPQAVDRAEAVTFLLALTLGGLLLASLCAALYAQRRRAYLLDWTLSVLCAALWRPCAGLAEGAVGMDSWQTVAGWAATILGLEHAALWALGVIRFRRENRPVQALPLAGEPLPVKLRAGATVGVLLGTLAAAVLLCAMLPWMSRHMLVLVVLGLVFGGSAAWLAEARQGPARLLLAATLGLYSLARLGAAVGLPMGDLRWGSYGVLSDFIVLSLTVVAMVVVLLDERQAELREALQRLAESEDRLRLLFEHGGVGLALLSPDGYFLHTNPALTRFLGYSELELHGRRLADLLHTEDRTSSYLVHLPVGEQQHDREKRFVHKDGRAIWARVVRVPVTGPDGTVRCHVCVLVDVSERRRAEELLREERDFREQILQTAEVLIVVTDPAGRIVHINAHAGTIIGRSDLELRGQSAWQCLLPRRLGDAGRLAFARLMACGRPMPSSEPLPHPEVSYLQGPSGQVVVEAPCPGRDGERRVAWRTTLLRDAQDQPRYVIAIGLDVTEQRSLEEQLAQSRKMESLAALVGGIAHDFNNQLTTIIGNLSLTLDDLEQLRQEESYEGMVRTTVEGVLPAVQDAATAAQCCAAMTARLLTCSGGGGSSLGPVALGALVSETARLLQHQFGPSIQVRADVPADVAPVQADANQVQELLWNLASNARDAMPDGGTLTLSLANRDLSAADCGGHVEARPGRFVELRIADTGHGMTPEVRRRLFEPMFSTRGTGRGMGLAVAFGIVRAHKGWITVESEVSRGSTLRVYLPAAPAPVEERTSEQPNGRPVRDGAPLCVLVVDDEPQVRNLACTVLQRAGCRVLSAGDGPEALATYQACAADIDLILLDYSMPGMTGLQVLEALRQLDPAVRVICASGYAVPREVQQLLDAGASTFIPKPYRPRELLDAVHRLLGGAKK